METWLESSVPAIAIGGNSSSLLVASRFSLSWTSSILVPHVHPLKPSTFPIASHSLSSDLLLLHLPTYSCLCFQRWWVVDPPWVENLNYPLKRLLRWDCLTPYLYLEEHDSIASKLDPTSNTCCRINSTCNSSTSSCKHTLHESYPSPLESPENVGKEILPRLIKVLNWLRKREIHKEYECYWRSEEKRRMGRRSQR